MSESSPPSSSSAADAPCRLRPDPARIIVPRKHGSILVEPPMSTLRDALAAGPCTPAANSPGLFGIPRAELRTQARSDLLSAIQQHAAGTNAPSPGAAALDAPWVITGHQVEFYHAGVWAKVVTANTPARSTHAVAIDLLVDHDVIDHLGFDMPAQLPDGKWARKSIEWSTPVEGAAHLPADSLSPPTPDEFAAWDAALAQHPTAHTDSLALILTALRPTTQSPLPSYPQWLSRARSQLESALDINVHHVTTSAMCNSAVFSLFVLAWIANADAWTRVYNTHLAAYRKAQGIHNDHHPMPDLHRDGAFELPFWIYTAGEPRARLIIRRDSAGHMEIHHGFEILRVPDLASLTPATALAAAKHFAETLSARNLRIRPRALTLTMFARLFLSDLFIHGIGGALYDQITNGILEDLFAEAPSYACVSAAWLLPLGQPLEGAADISSLQHLRHHLLHNPQIAIDPFTALKTDIAELITQRRELVKQIASSNAAPDRPTRRAGRDQRLAWYRQLHAINTQLHAKVPHILQKLDAQISAGQLAADQNKVLLWREYYFALHTLDSLRALIHKIRT